MSSSAYFTHLTGPETVGNAPSFRPLRRRIEAAIERLIEILDAIDGDPDLEPALGWTHTMAIGGLEDLEELGALRGGSGL